MTDKVKITIELDSIGLYDEEGDDLLYWDRQEWLDDPDLIVVVANAICFAAENGAAALRSKIKDGI